MVRKNSGFTLVEIIVTIAIIGILAAVATPSLLAWRQNTRFVGTIQQLASDLQRGKLMAVRENAQAQVIVNANDYSVFLDLNTNNSFDVAGDLMLADVPMPQGYTLTPASFFFNDRGTVPGIASEVIVQVDTPSNRQGFVRINVLGRIGHTF